MGLHIPNVKMPTSCCECYDAGLVAAQIVLGSGCPFCKQIGPPNAGLDEKRDPDCPLLFLQKHGRLGDLDALVRSFPYPNNEDVEILTTIVRNKIYTAPALIPAEQDGDI